MSRIKKTGEYTREIFSIFKRRGLGLSMENIAQELGVTKKTLYNNYEDRADLYLKVTLYFYGMLEEKIRKEIESENNCMAQMFLISKIVSSEIAKLGRKFRHDLSRSKNIFPLLNHARSTSLYSLIVKENIENGIRDGYYRDNIDIDIATLFYTSLIDAFYKWDDGEFKYLYEYEDYFKELVKYHLYSLTNSNGRKKLEEVLLTMNN